MSAIKSLTIVEAADELPDMDYWINAAHKAAENGQHDLAEDYLKAAQLVEANLKYTAQTVPITVTPTS